MLNCVHLLSLYEQDLEVVEDEKRMIVYFLSHLRYLSTSQTLSEQQNINNKKDKTGYRPKYIIRRMRRKSSIDRGYY